MEEFTGRVSGTTVLFGKDPGKGVWEWESTRNWDVWRFGLTDGVRAPLFTQLEVNELAWGFERNLVALGYMGPYLTPDFKLYLHDLATD